MASTIGMPTTKTNLYSFSIDPSHRLAPRAQQPPPSLLRCCGLDLEGLSIWRAKLISVGVHCNEYVLDIVFNALDLSNICHLVKGVEYGSGRGWTKAEARQAASQQAVVGLQRTLHSRN